MARARQTGADVADKEPHRWAAAAAAAAASAPLSERAGPAAAVHARRLKVVGQEKGGVILYAYDGAASSSLVRLPRAATRDGGVVMRACVTAHDFVAAPPPRGAWAGTPNPSQPGSAPVVTHIELLELATRRRMLLYVHTERFNVISASVNPDRTLLRKGRSRSGHIV